MLYAKVVLGLPVEGPFDYLVPPELESKISAGFRVWVNFRNKKEVAYVTGLSDKTKIKKIKEISAVIDTTAVLDEAMLLLTQELARYYCCSWGEAIEAALVDELRKGKGAGEYRGQPPLFEKGKIEPSPLFVQGKERMGVYLREIREAWAAGCSAIVLFPDTIEAERTKELIEKDLGMEVFLVFRKQPKELETWEDIRQAPKSVVIGTRSSIFSPVNNLGLIIIDQEQDQVYKQEQVPHYHARNVALMRARICGAKVVLGSQAASLESFYLAGQDKLKFEIIASKAYPLVQVIDSRRIPYSERRNKPVFSKFLLDAIYASLAKKEKILVFIERKGFATSAVCHNCGASLKCPRCNINLVFHFDANKLRCHHCNFTMDVPKICPSCMSGYIKYSGIGTEKIESELARIFPQAAVKIIDEGKVDSGGADIFVSTSSVIKHRDLNFDLTGVISIDNSLNRVDFRAAEKTFTLLMGLVNLTSKKMIIQSGNANHHVFEAVVKNDARIFLKEELKQRKQLNFPPYKHMILLKLRGVSLDKVKRAGQDLFGRLSGIKTSSIKVLSLNPGQPAKLRGNFYYQILMRASALEKAGKFLKLHLKEGRFSGIIVTVDVDPV